MSDNRESQCYLTQLQIDSYIDGDLGEAQQQAFLNHVHGCEDCAGEFRFAQTIQDGLLDLPILDCPESVWQQVQQINSDSEVGGFSKTSWLASLLEPLMTLPVGMRLAFSVLVLAIAGLITVPQLQGPVEELPVLLSGQSNENAISAANLETMSVEYSPQEIAKALQDLNLAIEYLNEVSQRTESMIGGRFLMAPLQDSLNASFERVRLDNNALDRDQI